MQDETTTAPAVEGVPAETGSQTTETPEQSGSQPQETVQPQGREEGQPTSSAEARKPSEYYKERQLYKKKIESLENTISEIRKEMASKKEVPASAPAKPALKLDPNKFWTAPDQVLAEILAEERKAIRAEIEQELREKHIPQYLSQQEKQREQERSQQEALELFFPKTGPEDRRKLEERVNADPERLEKIQAILSDERYGLDELSKTHPLQAANAAMLILQSQTQKPQAPKNPNAIKKQLVGSTATGSPMNAGGKKVATLNELKAQLSALDQKVDENPDLRYDDAFKAKKMELVQQVSALAKELGKQQQ